MAPTDSQEIKITEKIITYLREASSLEDIARIVKEYPDLCRDMPDARLNFIVIDSFEQAVQNALQNSPELLHHIIHLKNKLSNHYRLTADLEDHLLIQAIDAFQYAVQNSTQDSPDLYCYFKILGIFFHDLYKSTRAHVDLQRSINSRENAVKIAPQNSPELPAYLGDLGFKWYTFYQHTNELKYLQRSAEVFKKSVDKTPHYSPDLPNRLWDLSARLFELYHHTNALEDLQKCIEAMEEAVKKNSQDSRNLPDFLSNLGAGLLKRYEHMGAIEDLHRSIDLSEQAIQKIPKTSPQLPIFLNTLSGGLYKRYQHTHAMKDLQRSIELWHQILDKTPKESSEFQIFLGNLKAGLDDLLSLIVKLHIRHKETHEFEILQEIIDTCEQILPKIPKGSRHVVNFLEMLGIKLRDRYENTKAFEDLQKAIVFLEDAIQEALENSHLLNLLPDFFKEVGLALRYSYEHTGLIEDLQKSIKAYQRALQKYAEQSKIDSPNQDLINLGIELKECYFYTGKVEYLELVINAHEQAIENIPQNLSDFPGYLANIGISLSYYYERTGEFESLQRSIKLIEQAIQQSDQKSPEMPGYIGELGLALLHRYRHTGSLEDLYQSIELTKKAINKTPDDSPDLPGHLNNFANALEKLYEHTKLPEDLNQAIEAWRASVSKTPQESPDLPRRLSNLGIGFHNHYRHTGALADLEKAVDAWTQAVNKTHPGSPELSRHLSQLSIGLCDKYRITRELVYLEKAIDTLEKSIQQDTHHSPELPGKLNNLGLALYDLYTSTGKLEDWQRAAENFEKSAKVGMEEGKTIEAGLTQNWIRLSFELQDWIQVERAYTYFDQAVQKLLRIQLRRKEKETWLQKTQGMAAQAAYAFAKNKKNQKAVVVIERGLAQLLSESLALQHVSIEDLEQLRIMGYHELYDRYYHVMAQWKDLAKQSQEYKQIYNQLSSLKELNKGVEIKYIASDTGELTADQQFDQLRTRLPNVYRELETIIDDIQKINGYEDFLKPPSFSDIQTVTQDGTYLVYLLTTKVGGVALIVGDTTKSVWLPELTENAVMHVLIGTNEAFKDNGYLTAYNNWRQAQHCQTTRDKWYDAIESTTQWLWQMIVKPITDVLPTNAKLAFIPEGYLNLLPLHAAYIEDNSMPTGKRYLLDDFNIVYTPNARALDKARKIAHEVSPDSLLLIDEPKPVKRSELPNSNFEVQMIASTFDTKSYQIIRHTQANLANILETLVMNNYAILHFSCHGLAIPHNPLKSGLVMANDEFLTLEKLLNLHLNSIRLITLSACETGISGVELPDEMMNLSSGLLQAGGAGVLTSLWSVSELSTMMLMSKFYNLWLRKQIDPPEALRKAQIWVRDSTNKEKLDYFKSEKLPIHTKNPQIAQELVEKLEDRIGFRPDDAQDFSHPYHWAAFQYIGA